MLLAFTTIAHAATNDLTTLLQRGLFEEEANRNLDAAISNYQSLANDFDKDRQLAATAIFRLGECYRKLGRTNEAVAQYQRIVREFSDQQTLATLSQQNLAGLGAAQSPSEARASVLNRLEQTRDAEIASDSLRELQTDLTKEKADYDQKQTLLETLKKLSREDLRKALPTLVPDRRLDSLLRELDTAQQNLLQTKADFAPDHPKYLAAKGSVDDLDVKIQDRMKGILVGLQTQLDASKVHQDWLQKRIDLAEQSGGTQTATEQPPITDEEEKEIRRIQAMIQNSPDLINAPTGDPRMTPLGRAASLGQLRVAKFLLEAKADVNLIDVGGSPLYIAALNGQRAMVQLLLANGADVNARQYYGNTALSVAAEHGFVSVAETLLAAKADVNTQDSQGYTPLIRAVRGDHLAVAELLLAHGADSSLAATKPSNSGPSESDVGAPLHFAVLKGDKPMVSLLLSNHADIELRNPAPFHDTPLEIAAEGGRADIARFLLDAGANPNPEPADSANSPPLSRAAWRGDTNMVSLFLSKGADPNYANQSSGGDTTALMAAVLNDHPETVTILLRNKADPNIKGIVRGPFNGSTAFWYGFSTSGAKSVIPLLEYGADPNQTNNYGASPLMGVAQSDGFTSPDDRLAVAKLLIGKGANVNAKDNGGQTALHLAVLHDRPEMVELLLANKAEVNVADKSGRTPLSWASGPQSPQTPGAFVPLPPIRPLRNSSGMLSFEANNANPPPPKIDMVALLREHGALDELPNLNAIRVTREGLPAPTIVFERQSNDWNHYNLLETILHIYSLGQIRIAGNSWTIPDNALGFPNLARIIIHRPDRTQIGRTKEITVSLFNSTNGIDCSRDIPLNFGDIVEIPLRDYNLSEPQVGLTDSQRSAITTCLSRKVRLVVRGESREMTPWPSRAYLKAVLGMADAKSLLLSSSDLAHVKVTRKDPANGQTVDFVVDASNSIQSSQDLWLENGDVIQVPEKPE